MKRLESVFMLAPDAVKLFRDVSSPRDEPDRSLLQALEPEVARRYAEYDLAQLGALQPLSLNEAQREALTSNYNSSFKAFGPVYRKIRSLSEYCAYCDLEPTSTLDHYVAKTEFPEFSILPQNLIPSCGNSGCNSKRPWRDGSKKQCLLIHVYRDHIPDLAFLSAEVNIRESLPRVKFLVQEHDTDTSRFAERLRRHMTTLKLYDKYSREGERRLLREAQQVWAWLEAGTNKTKPTLRAYFSSRRQLSERNLGKNHFEVALFAAAALAEDFLDFCLTPPEQR